MRHFRLLICAHELSLDQGSECAVGWNNVIGMILHNDVTVLCANGPLNKHGQYRAAVKRKLEKIRRIKGLNVVYVEQPNFASFISKHYCPNVNRIIATG